jgi:ribosomal 50S subunit-recycling heat shock protein
MTRLDQYLKYTGLLKQRSEAKRACQGGKVLVDGMLAKAGRAVRVGEILTIDTPTRHVEAQVLDIPRHPVARSRRGEFCRIIEERMHEHDEQEEHLSFDEF